MTDTTQALTFDQSIDLAVLARLAALYREELGNVTDNPSRDQNLELIKTAIRGFCANKKLNLTSEPNKTFLYQTIECGEEPLTLWDLIEQEDDILEYCDTVKPVAYEIDQRGVIAFFVVTALISAAILLSYAFGVSSIPLYATTMHLTDTRGWIAFTGLLFSVMGANASNNARIAHKQAARNEADKLDLKKIAVTRLYEQYNPLNGNPVPTTVRSLQADEEATMLEKIKVYNASLLPSRESDIEIAAWIGKNYAVAIEKPRTEIVDSGKAYIPNTKKDILGAITFQEPMPSEAMQHAIYDFYNALHDKKLTKPESLENKMQSLA